MEIVDSSNITVSHCKFNQVGGNGVLLSNAVHDSTIEHNEFVFTGDSVIFPMQAADCGPNPHPLESCVGHSLSRLWL